MTGSIVRGATAVLLACALAVGAQAQLAPTPSQAAAAARASSLEQAVEARLAQAGPGPRFGLYVATADGREVIAIAPDARFMPASNTKIFTTAAAFATLPGIDRPDLAGGATVGLEARGAAPPDVVLTGHGDALLSSRADCIVDCLATLASAVAARVREVHDVIGDARHFPDERWSPGMSWNNLHSRHGTATSALTLDDNEVPLRVTPGLAGARPAIEVPAYYAIQNRAVTTVGGETSLDFARTPGSRSIEVTGTIAVGAPPAQLYASIDDPAHYAAWRLKSLLEARGVRVAGTALARYRPAHSAKDRPGPAGAAARPSEPPVLARLVAPPLALDLSRINKASQNLHAELMLRRVGRHGGSGSIADGIAVIHGLLASAGVPRSAFDFADGSGMSTYNRLSPRATVTFLRWIAAQPWGAAWQATLPIAGVDGTLSRRFRGTALERRLSAKTGSLNATTALSGTMTAASGRTLFFSALANDIPEGVSAGPAIDAALVMIAAQN